MQQILPITEYFDAIILTTDKEVCLTHYTSPVGKPGTHTLTRLLSKKISLLSSLLSDPARQSATKSENYLPKKHSRLDHHSFLNRKLLRRTGTEVMLEINSPGTGK